METRMEYARKMALKLREWDAAIDDLRSHAELAEDLRHKAEYNKKIVELREKRNEGTDLLRRVHEVDQSRLEEVRDAIDSLIGERRPSYRMAA